VTKLIATVLIVVGCAAALGCARAPLASETDPTDAGADAKVDRQITKIEAGCVSTSTTVHQLPAEVLIVLDKSGSMDDDAQGDHCTGGCGPTSKWTLVTTALDDVVGMTDAKVNWGLKFFATPSRGCGISNGVEVPVAPSNASAIMAAIAAASPGSSTPTRSAEKAGLAYLKGLADPNPKYLLLATDGMPNCNPLVPDNMMADDSAGAEQAVADALTAGVPTFVVGIGDTMAEQTLNALAQAGGKPQAGASTSFYQVGDTAELVTALGKILGTIPCTFDLGPPPNQWYTADAVSVTANGSVVPHDPTHANGWDFVPATTNISIYGPTCDAVMSGTITDVTIGFRCQM
jgi:hypothetical protein